MRNASLGSGTGLCACHSRGTEVVKIGTPAVLATINLVTIKNSSAFAGADDWRMGMSSLADVWLDTI